MKSYRLWIALFSLAGITGCRTVAESNLAPADFDPVAQVTPLVGAYRYEGGQKFDVGVAFFRTQSFDGTYSNQSDSRMAFALNGNPTQVSAATVNGVLLPWISDGSSWGSPDTYDKDDSNAYGAPDSMTFTYNGFDGESFTSTVDIAPSFGNISGPDTISASKGCTFKYDHFVPGDTITVSGYGVSFTTPDTGTITFRPNQLTYDSYVAQNGYEIYWSCARWTTRMSPSGKRIGIYSSQETSLLYPAKP